MWKCDTCGTNVDDSQSKCSLCGFGHKPITVTSDHIQSVIRGARELLRAPESWVDSFALSVDSDGVDIWDIEELDKVDRFSLCGAIDVAAHRQGFKVHGRGYGRSVTDQVVMFIYPLVWELITAPYPYPSEMYEDLSEGGSFMYEEYGYFNEQDGRTHAEVIGVLNRALAYLYSKTRPTLPTPKEAAQRAFDELAEDNKRKGIS